MEMNKSENGDLRGGECAEVHSAVAFILDSLKKLNFLIENNLLWL